MFRTWAIRAVAAVLVASAGEVGPAVAAPIPAGQRTYDVEASGGVGKPWLSIGSSMSYADALRAANRYKLQGYAVRMYERPGGRFVPVPSYEVGGTRRHSPGN